MLAKKQAKYMSCSSTDDHTLDCKIYKPNESKLAQQIFIFIVYECGAGVCVQNHEMSKLNSVSRQNLGFFPVSRITIFWSDQKIYKSGHANGSEKERVK